MQPIAAPACLIPSVAALHASAIAWRASGGIAPGLDHADFIASTPCRVASRDPGGFF